VGRYLVYPSMFGEVLPSIQNPRSSNQLKKSLGTYGSWIEKIKTKGSV
jgi:hypothetical protein